MHLVVTHQNQTMHELIMTFQVCVGSNETNIQNSQKVALTLYQSSSLRAYYDHKKVLQISSIR